MPSSIREIAKSIMPRSLRNSIRFAMWERGDAAYSKETGHVGFPQAYLRVRVHGKLDVPSFFQAGEQAAKDIIASVSSVEPDTHKLKRILDFGCGCGRTLPPMRKFLPDAQFYGADPDKDAIRWATKNLGFGEYLASGFEPPLAYADKMFDFIYGISVFTHIDERLQYLWLEELKRVTAPGGVVLLSVHGPNVPNVATLTPDQAKQYHKNGFHFVRDLSWSDFFPDYYQTTYHTRAYIEANWSKYFQILDYREKALDGHQDIVLLRSLD
jgi:SAM-dependent methyltransferase